MELANNSGDLTALTDRDLRYMQRVSLAIHDDALGNGLAEGIELLREHREKTVTFETGDILIALHKATRVNFAKRLMYGLTAHGAESRINLLNTQRLNDSIRI